MKRRLHLYFHSPCFDGIVSAVLARDFLSGEYRISGRDLHAVDYRAKSSWLGRRFREPSAVVDFLFHPEATFWADHHESTFLDASHRRQVTSSASGERIYDASSGSCALLLWRELKARFGHRNPAYRNLVTWADRIDSARYDSVREAVLPQSPALLINLSLTLGRSGRYCERLVELLRDRTLDEVAATEEVRRRAARVLAGTEREMASFERQARLENGVVVFDVKERGTPVNRYLPYLVFPKANYSAGIVRRRDGVKITAMRNPWKDFKGVRLGALFEAMGGGGHPRVGSVLLHGPRAASAPGLLKQLVARLGSGQGSRPRRRD